jgi:hypothetical protein
MTSPAQIDANRANAQQSTGPTTAAGKSAVRFNAMRHGLTSQVACMTWEDREAFDKFCAGLIADYRPEGSAETQLAQSIAEDHWRLNRARAIEHNIFALGFASSTIAADSDNPQIDAALAQAQTFRDEGKTFGLITLYEQRINRNLQRNLDRLRQLQSDRRTARTHALAELIESTEMNRLANKTAIHTAIHSDGSGPVCADKSQEQPALAAHGFVFSPDELALAQFRRRRANLHVAASQLTHPHSKRRLTEAA